MKILKFKDKDEMYRAGYNANYEFATCVACPDLTYVHSEPDKVEVTEILPDGTFQISFLTTLPQLKSFLKYAHSESYPNKRFGQFEDTFTRMKTGKIITHGII